MVSFMDSSVGNINTKEIVDVSSNLLQPNTESEAELACIEKDDNDIVLDNAAIEPENDPLSTGNTEMDPLADTDEHVTKPLENEDSPVVATETSGSEIDKDPLAISTPDGNTPVVDIIERDNGPNRHNTHDGDGFVYNCFL